MSNKKNSWKMTTHALCSMVAEDEAHEQKEREQEVQEQKIQEEKEHKRLAREQHIRDLCAVDQEAQKQLVNVLVDARIQSLILFIMVNIVSLNGKNIDELLRGGTEVRTLTPEMIQEANPRCRLRNWTDNLDLFFEDFLSKLLNTEYYVKKLERQVLISTGSTASLRGDTEDGRKIIFHNCVLFYKELGKIELEQQKIKYQESSLYKLSPDCTWEEFASYCKNHSDRSLMNIAKEINSVFSHGGKRPVHFLLSRLMKDIENVYRGFIFEWDNKTERLCPAPVKLLNLDKLTFYKRALLQAQTDILSAAYQKFQRSYERQIHLVSFRQAHLVKIGFKTKEDISRSARRQEGKEEG